jgi:uncharacterized protein YbcI
MATVNNASAERRADEIAPAIALRIAQLHKRRLGRGPRRVRVHLFDDLLVAVLEGYAGPLELTLRDQGRRELLRTMRDAVHPAIEPELRAIVEGTLMRSVTACMTATDPDADVATLTFTLDGQSEDLRARARQTRRDSEALQSDSRALRAQSEQALRRVSQIVERSP